MKILLNLNWLIVIWVCVYVCVFVDNVVYRRQQQKGTKLSVTSSGNDITDATRVYDRRLTGSASASALGYFESVMCDDIWYSGESSSSAPDITPSTSSSSGPLRHSPDDEDHHQRLHRSSPLTALNSIYVIDQHSSPTCGRHGGVVNSGFVGDGILTDSWRRVSWRSRLRAGIARSTMSSDPGPRGRRPSYLSDVIDSVSFFSNSGESAATTHARCELPLTSVNVARCQSDGGEWTLRRDQARPSGHRPVSLVNDRPRHKDHTHRQPHTYYTYAKHDLPSGHSTEKHQENKRPAVVV